MKKTKPKYHRAVNSDGFLHLTYWFAMEAKSRQHTMALPASEGSAASPPLSTPTRSADLLLAKELVSQSKPCQTRRAREGLMGGDLS